MYTAFSILFQPLAGLVDVYCFLLLCTCYVTLLVNTGEGFIVYRTEGYIPFLEPYSFALSSMVFIFYSSHSILTVAIASNPLLRLASSSKLCMSPHLYICDLHTFTHPSCFSGAKKRSRGDSSISTYLPSALKDVEYKLFSTSAMTG